MVPPELLPPLLGAGDEAGFTMAARTVGLGAADDDDWALVEETTTFLLVRLMHSLGARFTATSKDEARCVRRE